MTVHFVYVHGNGIDTTTGIVREAVPRLRARHDVVVHSPNDPAVIHPKPGDILIGHPNRHGDCLFRRSFAQQGWARRIVFAPMSHAVLTDAALIDNLVVDADLHLAITGQYWIDTIAQSPLSHWQHKTIRTPLGINRAHFPPIKSRFNSPGKRRFLCIGNADFLKGGDRLAALADANPDTHFGWIRTSDTRHCLRYEEDPATPGIRRTMRASRLHEYPVIDWRRPDGWRIMADYDFFILLSRSEALPCEVLEAASYGLVPVLTPHGGFAQDDWITHVPGDNIPAASAVIQNLQHAPEQDLLARQAAGRRRLDDTYTWDAVAAAIETALTCDIPRDPDNPVWRERRLANRKVLRRIAAKASRADLMARLRSIPRRLARGA